MVPEYHRVGIGIIEADKAHRRHPVPRRLPLRLGRVQPVAERHQFINLGNDAVLLGEGREGEGNAQQFFQLDTFHSQASTFKTMCQQEIVSVVDADPLRQEQCAKVLVDGYGYSVDRYLAEAHTGYNQEVSGLDQVCGAVS